MNVARKFTLALLTGILFVHAGAAYYRIQREQTAFEQDVARDAKVIGRMLGHAVESTWLNHGEAEALEVVEHATEREMHIDIRWVWVNASPGDLRAPTVPSSALAGLERGETVIEKLEGDGVAVLYTYVPVLIEGLELGAIEVSDPLGDEERYLARSVINAVFTMLVLVALCAGLSWVLGLRLVARPVRRLVEQARAIGRGDLDRRLHLSARDELGELASEMNQMCDRLVEARERLEVETQTRIAAVEQLRHADRLKTVGTLASGIAHELGTPINVIEGHAALLREDAAAGPAAKESADVIGRQCKRMATIIRQLLDFARRGGPRSTSSDALEVARQTAAMVAPLARQQGVELTVQGEPEGTPRIAFGALQQVLANLFVNALHAMPDGGALTVDVEDRDARAPGAKETRGYVALSVRDTGVGMPPEVRERIFEPFFTTKDVGEGTGLGLAVAYAIVEDHGGFIDVESAPGRGSTFTVYLPREQSLAT